VSNIREAYEEILEEAKTDPLDIKPDPVPTWNYRHMERGGYVRRSSQGRTHFGDVYSDNVRANDASVVWFWFKTCLGMCIMYYTIKTTVEAIYPTKQEVEKPKKKKRKRISGDELFGMQMNDSYMRAKHLSVGEQRIMQIQHQAAMHTNKSQTKRYLIRSSTNSTNETAQEKTRDRHLPARKKAEIGAKLRKNEKKQKIEAKKRVYKDRISELEISEKDLTASVKDLEAKLKNMSIDNQSLRTKVANMNHVKSGKEESI